MLDRLEEKETLDMGEMDKSDMAFCIVSCLALIFLTPIFGILVISCRAKTRVLEKDKQIMDRGFNLGSY